MTIYSAVIIIIIIINVINLFSRVSERVTDVCRSWGVSVCARVCETKTRDQAASTRCCHLSIESTTKIRSVSVTSPSSVSSFSFPTV